MRASPVALIKFDLSWTRKRSGYTVTSLCWSLTMFARARSLQQTSVFTSTRHSQPQQYSSVSTGGRNYSKVCYIQIWLGSTFGSTRVISLTLASACSAYTTNSDKVMLSASTTINVVCKCAFSILASTKASFKKLWTAKSMNRLVAGSTTRSETPHFVISKICVLVSVALIWIHDSWRRNARPHSQCLSVMASVLRLGTLLTIQLLRQLHRVWLTTHRKA